MMFIFTYQDLQKSKYSLLSDHYLLIFEDVEKHFINFFIKVTYGNLGLKISFYVVGAYYVLANLDMVMYYLTYQVPILENFASVAE